jgi:antitoxin component of RelBE/YafQ-DinJ toxin-antitoxin module
MSDTNEGDLRLPARPKLNAGTITIRLGPSHREALRVLMEQHGMKVSQALRMVIEIGINKTQALDETWRTQAFNEGVMKGLKTLREAMNKAFDGIADDG